MPNGKRETGNAERPQRLLVLPDFVCHNGDRTLLPGEE